MNLNYAIFRSEPIMTIPDLAQIGSHNKREKKAYNSNPDIKQELSKNNIELVPLTEKYVKGFYNLTNEYRKQHEEKQKTERADRKKTFNQMLNKSRNVVADELLFTATSEFFKEMTIDDIKDWANTCMEFVYNDLGYTKEQVLHSVVHLDEKTPHIHCVVVPLVKKFDNRTNTERYTITKKEYIKNKIHLSQLQDMYHKRLVDKGYDLERGIKGSDNQNINIKQYKQMTKKLNHSLNVRNEKFDSAMSEFEENMKSNKNAIFDKEYVKVKIETFDSMNKVINESKKVREIQPKLQTIFNEVENYANSYKSLEKQNKKYAKEINILEKENKELRQENNHLRTYLEVILIAIKKFFRKVLQIGDEDIKEVATNKIKEYYDSDDFNKKDVKDISVGTTKQDELFEYADISDYYKERVKDKYDYEYENKDYDLER